MSDPLPRADAACDGGDLDCGSGLLLIIRAAMQPLASGGVLLVKSRERSVKEDLPAWCRMVGHTIVAEADADAGYVHYYLRKRLDDDKLDDDLKRARNHVWQTRSRWKGGMRANVTMRNHGLDVGQPASFDVEDEAPSALELLLAAVSGALTTGFQWRLSRLGVEVRNLEVVVKGRLVDGLVFLGMVEDGNPGLAELDVAVYLDADTETPTGDVDFDAVFAETLRRCPVTRSVRGGTPVKTQLRTV
ncbi:MAG: hypothetical protein RL398_1596 [Planctomycetota bacterium]|jgi:TusA-related sulfurtransferase/uncharacterized OsmC-like protein